MRNDKDNEDKGHKAAGINMFHSFKKVEESVDTKREMGSILQLLMTRAGI